jgi:hypothetical protein
MQNSSSIRNRRLISLTDRLAGANRLNYEFCFILKFEFIQFFTDIRGNRSSLPVVKKTKQDGVLHQKDQNVTSINQYISHNFLTNQCILITLARDSSRCT